MKETAPDFSGCDDWPKPLKDHPEVARHQDAFSYVEGLSQVNTKLGECEIKDIHSLVLMHAGKIKVSIERSQYGLPAQPENLALPPEIEEKTKFLLRTNEECKKDFTYPYCLKPHIANSVANYGDKL